MIITFTSKAWANITMHGPIAIRLLKMMGHSGTVPGAILAADISAALDHLERGLDSSLGKENTAEPGETDDPYSEIISLRTRAVPLVEMLRAAAQEECDVMWDEGL